MNNKTLVGLVCVAMVATFAAVSVLPSSARAHSKSNNPKGVSEAQSFRWHDGRRMQQAWLDPSLTAEFGAQGLANESVVAKVVPQAQLIQRQGSVRVWRLPQSSVHATRFLTGLGHYSPVLRDGAADGPMRALPGGVIVMLDPSWSPEEVRNWASSMQLTLVGATRAVPNGFVVASEPGLAVLDLAERLRFVPGVVSAVPNWWREMHAR